MKRITFLFVLLLFILPLVASDGEERIPADSELRQGVLENSLHYYIRHNAKPKGQADFYILSDVGAIQEADDQQGLAHFMEHMAFNGTRNMPDKMVIEYLESIGVKFGANLNAATSWDYTVYMMKDVPVERESVVDSVMLILHDWAGFIEPQSEEIDKERGVIKEELRTRDGAGWRSTLALIGALGRGTRYEERNLIGYLDYLNSFEDEVLVRFYHDWYRPDYQAIIIVGDVDVDRTEQELKRRFADLPAAREDAPQKEVIRVPDNEVPIVEIFTDPELQYSSIQYFVKREARDKSQAATMAAAREGIMDAVISQMQRARFDEVVMSPNAPILGGSMSLGGVGVIPTLESTTYMVQSAEGRLDEALREVVEQMERARRYGFKEGEFERAKMQILRSSERAYVNRADNLNNSYVNRYIYNYRFGDPIPSAHDEWRIDSMLVSALTLECINERVETLFSDENNVVVINSPCKEGLELPSVEDVLSIIDEVRAGDVEGYEDKSADDNLIDEGVELKGSTIVSQSENELYGVTEWILSNGIQVLVKPTQLKADEVLLSAYTKGGTSLLEDELFIAGDLLSYLQSHSGLAEFSRVELTRKLSGRLASISSFASNYSHGMSGSGSPADLETMLQMLYLNFTAPRFDTDDFEVFKRKMRANIENQLNSPDYAASRRFAEVAYGYNLRHRPLNLEDVEALTLDAFVRARDILFTDGDNFTFTIVGNVDLEELKPLVERYIGSLPTVAGDAKMSYVDDGVRPLKGMVRDDFEVAMTQPKVGVKTLMSNKIGKFTLRDGVVASYMRAALDDLLLKSVREEMGGTYGVGVRLSLQNKPYNHYLLTISYDTNEEQFEELQQTIFEQIEHLAREGSTEEQMTKSREFMLKDFGNQKERNQGWMSYISSLYNEDIDYIAEYEDAVRGVTSEDVRRLAKSILRDKSRIEVIMHPQR